jgi:preprotein translocase subunit SecB
MPQSHSSQPAKETLPTMYDLKSEDPEEPGLPDEFHDLQPQPNVELGLETETENLTIL